MHLVMTGDRSLLAGRISALCEEKLVFKLAEKEDYALAGLRPRDLPDDIPPGRAFRAVSGTEMQVALLGPDASGQGQAAALRSIAAQCRSRDQAVPAAQRPFRVDLLPTARLLRATPGSCAPQPPARCGAWSASAVTPWRRSARTSPPACPASSWPALPSRGGPPSCCPWPGRSSRPERRSYWRRHAPHRCAHSPALRVSCGCSTRRSSAARNSPAPVCFDRAGRAAHRRRGTPARLRRGHRTQPPDHARG